MQSFATELGSAYVTEQWAGHPPGGSPLQTQVRMLFAGLGVQPENVLAGNLVPFRSPDWASLKQAAASLRFGEELWGNILRQAEPSLVIALGRQVFSSLHRVLDAGAPNRTPLGSGSVSGSRSSFRGGTLVGLPHLSRFAIFGRQQSEIGIRTMFGDHWLTR